MTAPYPVAVFVGGERVARATLRSFIVYSDPLDRAVEGCAAAVDTSFHGARAARHRCTMLALEVLGSAHVAGGKKARKLRKRVLALPCLNNWGNK